MECQHGHPSAILNGAKWKLPRAVYHTTPGLLSQHQKQIIYDLVAKKEPQINWQYTRNSTLKKENFDMTDAYTCALGYMKMMEIW
jgi:hypothetical protein